jgi:L-ascorbate metabolism protein UlaG (beta-lactamase superfamily)
MMIQKFCFPLRQHAVEGDHCSGKRFTNEEPVGNTIKNLLKWAVQRKPKAWPDWVPLTVGPTPPNYVAEDRVRITVINHSTALIQVAGLNILTDPVWSERVSPVGWAGPKRVIPPGLAFEQLPPIHVVLISHDHYDHLDIPTLEMLHQVHRPLIVAGIGVNKVLKRESKVLSCVEMNWWNHLPLSEDVQVHMVPARHFSGRSVHDKNHTLWGGFVLDAPGGPIYFAGDTGYGRFVEAIRARFGPMRFALLPIGAYEPRWFIGPVHLSPTEAVRVHKQLGVETSMAIHYGTFRLADEGYFDPIIELRQALAVEGIDPHSFLTKPFGQPFEYSTTVKQNCENHRLQIEEAVALVS